MGIKKFFKIKPPEEDTPEQNRDTLMELGISTKNPQKKKKEKFAAYGSFAREKAEDRVYAPPGYENYGKSQDEEDLNKSALDSEASGTKQSSADPYSVPSGGLDPYAVDKSVGYQGDPYANFQSNSMHNKGQQYRESGPNRDYNSGYDGLSSYNNNSGSGYGSEAKQNPYGQSKAGYSGQNYNAQATGSRQAYNRDSSSPQPSNPGNGAGASYGTNRGANPYGANGGANPYGASGSSNPYGGSGGSNPYGTNGGSSYERSGSLSNHSIPGVASSGGPNPYAAIASDSYASGDAAKANPYPRQRSSARAPARAMRGPNADGNRLRQVASTAGTVDLNKSPLDGDDLNQEPRAGEFDFEEAQEPIRNTVGVDELDLNATMNEGDQGDDLNAPYRGVDQQQTYQTEPQWQMEEEEHQQQDQYEPMNNDRGFRTFEDVQREEEARQQQEEDEAVDEIKQDIRFTKQSSMASTRNTLRMAQEAEMSGMNTLGLLGHQSEKLNNVERNLDLLKVQNKIADDKVAELKKLNRNILAVHVSNPFNSRRRQRDREENIKNRKIEEKVMQEHTSQQLSNSTQRIEGAMKGNSETGVVREKYQRQQILERSKKYQFENDEEDDMMEVEIDRNLDQIQQISGRLKKLAVATGGELDSQQGRVKNIEDNTDDLDIKIHLNTTRLSGIR